MSDKYIAECNKNERKANQRGLTNQFNLEKRVKALHQARIRSLQKEMIEISLQNNRDKSISSLLAEIKRLRELLKCTGNKNPC